MAAVELAHQSLESVDYGIGGQFYGMDGSLEGPRLTGTLALTNIATNRPDNVNTPTLRGLLRTQPLAGRTDPQQLLGRTLVGGT